MLKSELRAAALAVRRYALPAAGALAALAFVFSAGAPAPSIVSPAKAADAAFSEEQRSQIGEIVKDYLLKHPEIIMDVQAALEAKMEKEQAEKLKAFMSENAKDIYRSPGASVAGNPDGDITVVEFFDYNCGYCKRGMSEIQKLIEMDKRVRVVFQELPILSKGSEDTAKAALAAKRQGKYWEFHQAMLSAKGQANEASSLKAAEGLGIDMEKFKADLKSAAVTEELDKMKALAKKMGISGTPHFLVGDRSIADFRKSGCGYC
jgi:protein-disulfide isomerase